MKNGKVKSLEVSYYSNGGNSADLSHGVSKINLLIDYYAEGVFPCIIFYSDFRAFVYSSALTSCSLMWLKTVLDVFIFYSFLESTGLPWHVSHSWYWCFNNLSKLKRSRMFALRYRGLWQENLPHNTRWLTVSQLWESQFLEIKYAHVNSLTVAGCLNQQVVLEVAKANIGVQKGGPGFWICLQEFLYCGTETFPFLLHEYPTQ